MNQMTTTTTNPGSTGSLSAESGLPVSDVMLQLLNSFDQGKSNIEVPGDVRSEEVTQEIYRDFHGVTHRGTNNIPKEPRATILEIFANKRLGKIEVPGDVRSEEVTQEIYRDVHGVMLRGTNNILLESLAKRIEEIFAKPMGKIQVTAELKSEELIEEIFRDFERNIATMQSAMGNTENHDLCLAASQGAAINHLIDIPFPVGGARRRGTITILKQSLTFIVKEVAKIMICAGKKVENPILMGMIALPLTDLATTRTATTVSWFDKAKPVLYCLLCASQISVMVLRPAKNTTPSSAATSSPAPVNANAKKLGDLIAGAALLCSAFSIFCRCVGGITLAYAVTVVTVCTALVLGCALFAFYSNPN